MLETSEQLNELFKAMAEFQKEVEQPKKDADNPFFKSKYVPLENVIDAIHKVGSKHGLSEITYPVQSDGQVGVGVIITHSSGQYMKLPPILLKPDKNTPQGIGSATTYARRYALSAAFGIASETDDDGNSISGNEKQPKQQKTTPVNKQISSSQVTVIQSLLIKVSEASKGAATPDGLLSKLNIKNIEYINTDQYGTALNMLNAWKKAYEKKAKEDAANQSDPIEEKEEPKVEQESILDRYGNPK